MKSICAWCQADMDPGAIDDGQISHGICPPCRVKFMAEMDEFFDEMESAYAKATADKEGADVATSAQEARTQITHEGHRI